MSSQVQEGAANIYIASNNFLTTSNNHAVVGLGTETKWHVKAYKIDEDSTPFFMILTPCEVTGEELCLTLDTNEGDNENNVMVEPVETPKPKTSQLWTFEEVAILESLPPIMIARIQSVARPSLSAAIGGSAALPKLYQNIAGVPNEVGAKSQKWRVGYLPAE